MLIVFSWRGAAELTFLKEVFPEAEAYSFFPIEISALRWSSFYLCHVLLLQTWNVWCYSTPLKNKAQLSVAWGSQPKRRLSPPKQRFLCSTACVMVWAGVPLLWWWVSCGLGVSEPILQASFAGCGETWTFPVHDSSSLFQMSILYWDESFP